MALSLHGFTVSHLTCLCFSWPREQSQASVCPEPMPPCGHVGGEGRAELSSPQFLLCSGPAPTPLSPVPDGNVACDLFPVHCGLQTNVFFTVIFSSCVSSQGKHASGCEVFLRTFPSFPGPKIPQCAGSTFSEASWSLGWVPSAQCFVGYNQGSCA